MSDTSGTCNATAITRRQQIGMIVTMLAFLVLFVAIWASWILLWTMTEGFKTALPAAIGESVVLVTGWAYAYSPDGTGMWYAVPPGYLVVMVIVGWLLSSTISLPLTNAIARAKGRRMMRRASLKVEAGNLQSQLREQQRTGLFVRGRAKFVRMGLLVIGAVIVLETVLLYPATATGTSGAAFDVEWGLPMWASVVGSVVAIFGCLLMLPFRAEDDVVIDASGYLTTDSEQVVPPPHVPQPHAPASA